MATTSAPIAANLVPGKPAFQISIPSDRRSTRDTAFRTSEVRKTASNHVCPCVLERRRHQQLSGTRR